jgi:hypothetical protein
MQSCVTKERTLIVKIYIEPNDINDILSILDVHSGLKVPRTKEEAHELKVRARELYLKYCHLRDPCVSAS